MEIECIECLANAVLEICIEHNIYVYNYIFLYSYTECKHSASVAYKDDIELWRYSCSSISSAYYLCDKCVVLYLFVLLSKKENNNNYNTNKRKNTKRPKMNKRTVYGYTYYILDKEIHAFVSSKWFNVLIWHFRFRWFIWQICTKRII